MAPFFRQLGITRLAKQTGLDDIGIPCYASFRPTSRTLSTNQGKGASEDEARASAVMEAVEFAVAEAPRSPQRIAALAELEKEAVPVFWPSRLLPANFAFDANRPIRWLHAEGLLTKRQCLVPLDAVSLSAEASDLPGICQCTNGLASGNNRDEAIFHALCELIERDGTTRWLLLPQHRRHRTRFNPASLGDDILDGLVDQVLASGKHLTFYDLTTDLGIPVVMALIADVASGHRFDLAAGYGAHLDAARAARRAVTEAAQTRITSIAAARDDIPPDDFQRRLDGDGLELATPVLPSRRLGPPSLRSPNNPKAKLNAMVAALKTAGLAEPIVVNLDDGTMPCAVVRLLSLDLEDIEANLHWRPGSRALKWQSQ